MTDIKTELDKMLVAASAPQAPAVSANAPIPAPPLGLTRINSKAEFEKALATAPGPIAVLWTQSDCDFCVDDKKALEELAAKCPCNLTALEVNTDSDELNDLAEQWDVDGTPTLLFAKSSKSMTPDDSEEVDPKGLRRRLKCALPKRGRK